MRSCWAEAGEGVCQHAGEAESKMLMELPSNICALLSPCRWFREGRAAPPLCLPLAAKQLQQCTGPGRHPALTSRFEGIQKAYSSTLAAKLVTGTEVLRVIMGQREEREEKWWGDEERTTGDQARTEEEYAEHNLMEDLVLWKLKIQYSFIFFSIPKLNHFYLLAHFSSTWHCNQQSTLAQLMWVRW